MAAELSPNAADFIEAYRLARDEVTAAIYAAAGIREEDDTEAFRERVAYIRRLDRMLTASERRDLMAPCALPGFWQLPAPFPVPVKAWGEDKARTELELRLKFIGIHTRG